MLDREVITLYPDCGKPRFKLLFNQKINPRVSSLPSYDALYILFCNSGPVAVGQPFQLNHFVPIIIKKKELKREAPIETQKAKSSVSKKSALSLQNLQTLL